MEKETLKDLREKNGYTQNQVANITGTTTQYISMLENNSRNPSDNMKKKLAKLYGCSVTDIFLATQTTKC